GDDDADPTVGDEEIVERTAIRVRSDLVEGERAIGLAPVDVGERRRVGDDEALVLGDADGLGDEGEDAVMASDPATEAEAELSRGRDGGAGHLLELADEEIERLVWWRVVAGAGEDVHAVMDGVLDRVAQRLAVGDPVG